MKKIAVFGGSFNPVHWGHLLMAEAALDQAQLDRVLWVPSYRPPHKLSQAAPISYHHRLEMVKLAIDHHPNFRISTIERDRPGISYAVDTLSYLQQSMSNTEWFWVIGLDAFRTLPHWHGDLALIQSCQWLVAPRLDAEKQLDANSVGLEPEGVCQQVAHQLALASIDLNWQLLTMPLVNLSASLIRTRCEQGRSIRYLVPEPVREYLLEHQLYQTTGILPVN